MRRVEWSDRALDEIAAIRRYIAEDDPFAAERIAKRLASVARSLEIFPGRGRSIGQGLRQISTVYPYLIRYRVLTKTVKIVSVRHGARR